ncbi:MAG TPA: MurR/RpiR family transcriptional regulator [Nocardioidaceae bacterium]|nr:MurR/RpiR family transcriptional regulator [Nocardioidaceae bacterium]
MTSAAERGGAGERLYALFRGHRLSPTQRRIGQFVLENLPGAALMTSVELARRTGVSQPSVTRFAVALGFSGYPQLRAEMSRIVLGVADDEPSATPTLMHRAVDAEIDNLRALRKDLDTARLGEVGAQLVGSRPLPVLAARISAPVAGYFAYCASRIHPDVRPLTGGGTQLLDGVVQARVAGAKWLLAFALPRYPDEIIAALDLARQEGLSVAVVTDSKLAIPADYADELLSAPVPSELVFDSHAAPMLVAAMLLQAMADADQKRTRTRLDRYEEVDERLGVYAAADGRGASATS